jgi:hypothetical protein
MENAQSRQHSQNDPLIAQIISRSPARSMALLASGRIRRSRAPIDRAALFTIAGADWLDPSVAAIIIFASYGAALSVMSRAHANNGVVSRGFAT